MTGPVRIDAEFWSRFAAHDWEARSFVAEQVLDVAIPRDPADLFEAMIAVDERCPAGRREKLIQIYVDGRRVDSRSVDTLVPKRGDKSLAGYDARMHDVLGGREYLVRMEKLHGFYAPYWEGAYQIVQSVARHVGLSPGADTSVFMGRYRRTPTGVHYDNLSSFNFPVLGTKTMRVWPREYVAAHPDLVGAREYEAHVGASQALRATAGGMIYWPSSAFHIGEGDGTLTATLGVGIWIDKRPLGLVMELLTNLVAAADPAVTQPVRVYPIDVDDLRSAAERLPPPLEALVDVVERVVAGGALRDAVTDTWLETITDLNLKRLPPEPIDAVVGDDDRVVVDGAHPIVWTRRRDGRLIAATRGMLLDLRDDDDTTVIAAFDGGRATSIRELAARSRAPIDRVRVLVQNLVRAGFVRLAYQ